MSEARELGEETRMAPILKTADKEPFNVRCGECKHTWTAAYTPLSLVTMGELLQGLHCPMCGIDSSKIFAAIDGPITFDASLIEGNDARR